MSNTEQRKKLEALQSELQGRISAIEKDISQERSRDSEDQAQERENDDVLHGLMQEARDELKSIAMALEKMDAGTYGECSNCGATIEPRRLESVPYANYCIHCAS